MRKLNISMFLISILLYCNVYIVAGYYVEPININEEVKAPFEFSVNQIGQCVSKNDEKKIKLDEFGFFSDDGVPVIFEQNDERKTDILSKALEHEWIIAFDLKSEDEENRYPEIERTALKVYTPETSGGRLPLFGKNYRVYLLGENEFIPVEIKSSNIKEVKFNVDKLGFYVVYFDPRVYSVKFYDSLSSIGGTDDIKAEEYYVINNLNATDIVEFPYIPKKDGYVFTGWKSWSGSGIYFTEPQPVTARSNDCYYASWCPIEEYEPIKIEISSEETIIKGKEDGKKIILKTNYGIFSDEEELNAESEYWNVINSNDIKIDSVTRIDDKTVELTLSGNSEDIYKSSDIQIEFDSCLLQWEKYDEDDNLIYEEDEVIQMDEDGMKARMYRSDNSVKLSKQSRPGGNAGLGVPKYTITFETNGGSNIQKQVVSKNIVAKMPELPQKEDAIFAGWFLDKEFTREYNFTEKVTKNITLFAKWDEIDNTENQIVLTIGKKEAAIFGEKKENDVAPVIYGDRAYLPARFVAESLGALVEWNGEKQEVTITKDDVKIIIAIGEKIASVNGEATELDAPAFIENDRTYTPIRFIAEKLGCDVDWNPDGGIITITK